MGKDFYAVLSLPRNASQKEIRARFLEMAREGHPDRFKGEEKAAAEVAFQDVTEAFNVLSDPLRRHQHDLDLDRPKSDEAQDPDQMARVYINRGIRAYREEKYIEAASNFNRATDVSPGNHQAWHHLALTCVHEERWLPKAREAITRACEIRPTQVSYLKLAGKIFAQSKMMKEARRYYNEALRLDETDLSIRKALQDLGRPAGAKAARVEKQESGKSGLFRKIW